MRVLLEEASPSARRGKSSSRVNRDYPEEETGTTTSPQAEGGRFPSTTAISSGLPASGTIYEMVTEDWSYEDLMRKYESEYEPEKPKGFTPAFSVKFRVIRV